MRKDKTSCDINALCQRCERNCKQLPDVKLIKCPYFEAAPQQLEIPLIIKHRGRTKAT